MRTAVVWVVGLLIAACAGPVSPQGARFPASDAPSEGRPTGAKRIVAAITGDLPTLSATLNRPLPGGPEVERMISAGLTSVDDQGDLRPQLADAVPTVENGLWKVHADGSMETTWNIRRDARWHDGTRFTTEDLLFTARVVQDPDVAAFRDAAFASIESIEAPDLSTVTVKWKRPLIIADAMFSYTLGLPLPKHLLERSYSEDKATFTQAPYWSQEFVGTGPYRLVELAHGSHLVLQAFDFYVLGRPKIDQIEVRFIQDPSTLMANVLAGAVDITVGGRNISLEQGKQILEQGWDGRLDVPPSGWQLIFPQFVNPSPSAVGSVEFRRALLHAIDRQVLADTLMMGLTSVAHTFLDPSQREYREIEASATRYEYEPRRAVQTFETLGYTKGPDGLFQDTGGQKLSVELRTFVGDINEKSQLIVTNSWQHAGLSVSPFVVPTARQRDREYMATFPGFILLRQPTDLNALKNFHSSRAPLAENNFIQASGGTNFARYVNPEMDALIDKVFMTIPWQERMQVLREAVRHSSERLNAMGLFYISQPNVAGSRLQHVTASRESTWNVHAWDIK